ncbi:RNase H domain-containing protein [Trichonephila clavipes]|nr:RNase H domain-containing protein [Trichonephila clavipes]
MKRVIMHHIFKIWQESWSQQLDNKLHSVKPVIGEWPVMPMRRTDVKLTRLRIGHTRFTHRHLLFGEQRRRRIPCDFQKISLAGLALDSATSSGLGRAPRSAMQDPIQAPPGATRQAGLYTS